MINDLYNKKLNIDSIELLKIIPNNHIKCTFYDPQYRGILDKLSYGNEGDRQIDRSILSQMDDEYITNSINLINNILLPSGYLFLWIDKFHLCENSVKHWAKDTDLSIVDLIVWNKMKMGMGYRSRRISEYLMVLQKKPTKAKATWKNHAIPDVYNEKIINKIHPHQKPKELQEKLLLSVTEENDVVLDPCAGSFTIMDICINNNRNFLGTDIKF